MAEPVFFNYMTARRKKIVVVCEDMDFVWDEHELKELARMNIQGKSIKEMNEVFQRKDIDEIFLALFHLARIGKVKNLTLETLLKESDLG